MTVKVDIRHMCGCGFSTRDIDSAVAHCNSTSHTLTTSGTICPKGEPKVVKLAKPRVATHEPAMPAEFENLRKKLGKG